ncbi:MAG: tetratricopeptide repeat protein [Mangrovicoccus sp.]
MTMIKTYAKVALLFSLVALAGCESVEKKAERKYETAQRLLAEDEPEKALIELRGIFLIDGEHEGARQLYAEINLAQGDIEKALQHFLLLSDQHPDNLEAWVNLAEVAVKIGDLDGSSNFIENAVGVDPEDSRVKALVLANRYFEAVQPNSDTADEIENIVSDINDHLKESPDYLISRMILIDDQIRENDYFGALAEIEDALVLAPKELSLHQTKLQLLERLDDKDGVSSQLKEMITLFPERPEFAATLVKWYLANGQVDAAEDFLRETVATSGEEIEPRVTLIRFLLQIRGPEAALEQLDVFVDEGLDDAFFKMLRASTIFDMGNRDEAITQLRTLLETQDASDTSRDMKVTLAKMLSATNQIEEAKTLIGQVLEEDNRHVEALKLQANWLIEEDLVRDAVLSLRTALDQSPTDADLMTLMAKAHEREGNRVLMGESLGRAVEMSQSGAEESLRYARYLMLEEKYRAAENVVIDALRRNSSDLRLLRALSEVYVALADWPRTEQIVQALRRSGSEDALNLANALEATLLQQMQRTDESIELLRNMLESDSTNVNAVAGIIRTHLANGQVEAARTFMDEILASDPEDSGVRFLNAALLTAEGDLEAAETEYKKLVSEYPEQEILWRAYVAMLASSNRSDAAQEVLQQAMSNLPDSPTLLWIDAGFKEADGDIQGAIEIYTKLYEKQSDSTVIANNLASLITSYSEDQADLERAFVIARRLRGTRIPAFQDTYGWITYRMGNPKEALEYLEPAARALPNDPIVRRHLGYVFAALDRNEDAISELQAALALWDGKENPQIAPTRIELERLQAEQASQDEALEPEEAAAPAE